jgi:hypothetical protein
MRAAKCRSAGSQADLPILQTTKFIVDLQTVETPGVEVPATLLAIAGEVIEWR